MSDIGPGDWVQCIESVGSVPAMCAGSVWLIISLEPPDQPCPWCWEGGRSGFVLLDDPDPPNEDWGGWCPCNFRPFKGPEQSSLICEPIREDAEG